MSRCMTVKMELLTDRISLKSYSFDASNLVVWPKGVVIAKDLRDIKETLQYAKSKHKKIIIRGSGTNLVGNAIGEGIVLDLSKLNKVLDFNQDNKTISVEPGVILAHLNNFLKTKNLIFPVIPSSQKEATIGGMISCNAAGRKAAKYGKTINWIDSLDVMLWDGSTIKIKGEDVLNFSASEGGLGIIIRANLKLNPLSIKRSLRIYELNTVYEVIDKLKLLNSQKASSVEFINPISASLLNRESKYFVFAEFDDDSGSIKDNTEIEKFWALRDDAYPMLARKGFSLIEDPELLDYTSLQKALSFFEKKAIPTFGHLGLGVVHPCFKANQSKLIKEMYDYVQNQRCIISGEHGYGLKKREYLCDDLKLKMISLKEKYDPFNLFNCAMLTPIKKEGNLNEKV